MTKVLIANRGEIACRIARACLDAQLTSVAVYAGPDADAPHVRMADEAWSLEGDTGPDTYLSIDKLLAVARRSGADAVHPGYGFLSENADFAAAVEGAGLVWIGPSPDAIRALGNKVTAREIAVKAGAPLVPGSDGPVPDAAAVHEFAHTHGLPVAIKAAFGGGGRGMRVVRRMEDVDDAFDSAVREAEAAFGNGKCFVERFLDKPRHVEAQVIADMHGNVVVAGTRDCSLQRRNQKLVEESPAPFLTADQRSRIHSSAKAICRAAHYRGAGTVEYLVGEDGVISFLEVNTRLQVEHPVTEETSGIDLVREQLRIADGKPLSVDSDPQQHGHAFEFRLNAEDPARGFLPTPGTVETFTAPTGHGIRVDSGVVSGSAVPGQFDSLLAKLIVTGNDRQQALRRARVALEDMRVTGIPTVLPFHRAIAAHPDFTATDRFGVYTTWIEDEFDERLSPSSDAANPEPDGERRVITIDLDGRAVRLGLPAAIIDSLLAGPDAGRSVEEVRPSGGRVGRHAAGGRSSGSDAPDDADLLSPISGSLVKWLADDGATVSEGDGVAVVEAMKMETTVAAHRPGTLTHGEPAPGDAVAADHRIATIE
ncbi:acetyl/propionyl/methylcrotonyl-CoA carboxylase subunit alpha [Spelaeicoccus albus]|uniref:acetyl/propionyl/methylcrotonyl-CoA carboxylase subunit alpha n=1 Tax=Spelaeicoccus albus TaxID=1280376 RepID=UPI0015C89F5E|nr:biotin carboxylase N-terminal domain-containing protein [Spelaeicoccus albus]